MLETVQNIFKLLNKHKGQGKLENPRCENCRDQAEPMSRSLPLPHKPFESTFARIFTKSPTSSLAMHALFRMDNQNKVIVKRRKIAKTMYSN